MANKQLATRQKMRMRIEPSQNFGKPRNPIAALAKARAAGPHDKNRTTAERQSARKLIGKKLAGSDDE
ncbi:MULTISPECIES: hypothetical protein [unclassified Duganella]|uniref:hypothetical protein n=1 Tax=unclassified Duganella TaxID=2636909 RepID=UPI0006FC40B6|nr:MULTISPECIES: hypothetical protein [unclassified Duganella]KQV55533.1 hypothetical protein ASD07_27690 [Duganella sp. Root336D2]KRC02598.1 hypothetical protein ASE26_19015 [Duganella sp. Root198D2]